jgi:hypothetical protein
MSSLQYWCFSLGWFSNFVGSESGQKQSRIWSTTQLNTPHPHPPQPQPVCIMYVLYVYFGKGEGKGGGGGQREGSGETVHKRGRKYQHDCLDLQSKNSIKHQ